MKNKIKPITYAKFKKIWEDEGVQARMRSMGMNQRLFSWGVPMPSPFFHTEMIIRAVKG